MKGDLMGILQQLAASGADEGLVHVALVSNQDNGGVCYAAGRAFYVAARVKATLTSPGQSGTIPAAVETRAFEPFRGGGPLNCYFSGDIGTVPAPTAAPQPFDANAVRDLEFRLTGPEGFTPSVRLKLPGRKPIVIAMKAQGELFTGIGRSLVDGAAATYVVAVTDVK